MGGRDLASDTLLSLLPPDLLPDRHRLMGLCCETGDIENLYLPTANRDQAVILQPGETPADGLDHQPQKTGDVVATHRKQQHPFRVSKYAIAFHQSMQEQQDPLNGLMATQHLDVILIAAHAAAHQSHQMVLQGRHLRRDPFQILKRHFAHRCLLQRFGVATMTTLAECVEANQLSRKVEADDLPLPVFRVDNSPERSFAHDEYGFRYRTGSEQRLFARNRTPAPDDPIKPIQIVHPDATWQA